MMPGQLVTGAATLAYSTVVAPGVLPQTGGPFSGVNPVPALIIGSIFLALTVAKYCRLGPALRRLIRRG